MPQLGSLKSRKGCKRCKQRRVKCDEQAPCDACVRRNEQCSLLEPLPDGRSERDAESWTLDLELMYHYTKVSHQLSARREVLHLWRDYIPQKALKHPFLLRALLAFAALHLAVLHPESSSKYLQLCNEHQDVALQEFRSVLSAPVDPELADALFALSATLAISYMARSCAVSEIAMMDMQTVAELFVLTKGVAGVIRLTNEHIRQGPMAAMLEAQGCPKGTNIDLPLNVGAQLQAIRQMLETYGLNQEELEDCKFALAELEVVYKNIMYVSPNENVETGLVSRWQVRVSSGYVRLFQAHNPPALVILAYYAAAFTAVRTAWYTQNWSESVLCGIQQTLNSDMQQLIQWPVRQIQERMSELGVQPLHDGMES